MREPAKARKRRYSLDPQTVGETLWYYEMTHGLNIVAIVAGKPTIVGTIPWRMVEKSMRRHQGARP